MKIRELDSGLFVPVTKEDEQKARKALYDKYYELHKYCPSCGSTNYTTTCMGVIIRDLEKDKDWNHIHCECGWKGIAHDLVGNKNEDL